MPAARILVTTMDPWSTRDYRTLWVIKARDLDDAGGETFRTSNGLHAEACRISMVQHRPLRILWTERRFGERWIAQAELLDKEGTSDAA